MPDIFTNVQYRIKMRKIVCFAVWFCMGLGAVAQNVYNIRGEKTEIPDSVQPVLLFFSTQCCHNCMYDAINYFNKLKGDNSQYELYVMIPGRDVSTMRYITSGLDEYFSKKKMPTVVYDLDKDTSKRFETKYGIRQYPCLFVFDKAGKCRYLSYDTLFGSDRKPSY